MQELWRTPKIVLFIRASRGRRAQRDSICRSLLLVDQGEIKAAKRLQSESHLQFQLERRHQNLFFHTKLKQADSGWYVFDDKIVQPWSLSQLDEDCFGGHSNISIREGGSQQQQESMLPVDRPNSAYMLFYELKESNMSPSSEAQPRMECGASAATCSIDKTPYDMPLTIYKGVLNAGLHHMFKVHVSNEEYAAFILRLVEGRRRQAEHFAARPAKSRRLGLLMDAAKGAVGAAWQDSGVIQPTAVEDSSFLPDNQSVRLAVRYICNVLVCSPENNKAAMSLLEAILPLISQGPGPCVEFLRTLIECQNGVRKIFFERTTSVGMRSSLKTAIIKAMK